MVNNKEYKGEVLFWSHNWGKILIEETGEETFFHINDCLKEEYIDFHIDDRVTFNLDFGQGKKMRAINVRLVE